MFTAISLQECVRMVVVYSHVIICVFALATVLKTDIKMIVTGVSRGEIEATGKIVFNLLAALWVTGLVLIYMDTGFSPDVLLAESKMLMKLVCVLMLTLNGLVLHLISLPILIRETVTVSFTEALILSVTGAVSLSHWLLSAFLGLSEHLGRFSFSDLYLAYSLFIVLVLVGAFCFVGLINRIKIGISGKRATDPPAARRQKLLDELVATPQGKLAALANFEIKANRKSDRKRLIFK